MHIVICMGLVWSVSVCVYAVERDPSDPRMSDEKLFGVLQQLVSAGKPSFADILSSPARWGVRIMVQKVAKANAVQLFHLTQCIVNLSISLKFAVPNNTFYLQPLRIL